MALSRRALLLGAGMGGFNNAILGGVSKLIRAAIQSPNYIPGVSGWTVNKDGSVEFTLGTFRGTIVISGAPQALLAYDGTPGAGKLVAAIAPNNGTDGYGNAYNSGLTIADFTGSGRIPPSNISMEFDNAIVGQLLYILASQQLRLKTSKALDFSGDQGISLDTALGSQLILAANYANVRIGAGQPGRYSTSSRSFSQVGVVTNTLTQVTNSSSATGKDLSDYGTEWTGGTYTCPVNSFYNAFLLLQNPGTGAARCIIRHNANNRGVSAPSGSGLDISTDMVEEWCLAGDTITAWVLHNVGSNQTVPGRFNVGRKL